MILHNAVAGGLFSSFLGFCMVLGMAPIAPVAAADTGASSAGVIAWLTIEPEPQAGNSIRLAISGHAFAATNVNGRYALEVRRSGRSGVSNSKQSGKFAIEAGRRTVLSNAGINVSSVDALEIELKLFVGEAEVFSISAKSGGNSDESRI